MCHISYVMCPQSHITCHVSCVACHMSTMPTAKAKDIPPDKKNVILAVSSLTRNVQLSRFRLSMQATHNTSTNNNASMDVATYRLNQPRGRFSENHGHLIYYKCQVGLYRTYAT